MARLCSWGSREPPGWDWAHSAVPCVRFSQPSWGVPNLPGCAPQYGAALMFPLPAADRELLPGSKRGDIPVTWCPGPLHALCL